jgi:stage V sporulation protein AE
MVWMYLKVFLVGGIICLIGELLVLLTKLTPARILVCYIVTGVALSAVGLYGPLVEFAGAGATVPLTGFGHALCQGVKFSVQENGLLGAFTGGLSATAGGIAAAVFFGALVGLVCKPRSK